jgi:hypothetical protein
MKNEEERLAGRKNKTPKMAFLKSLNLKGF